MLICFNYSYKVSSMKTSVKHLGIIMDGNRRWAKERGLLPHQGHLAGYEIIQDVLKWCSGAGIRFVTLYAFSTENWNRAQTEVSALMALFERALIKDIHLFHEQGFRVRVIGTRDRFSPRILQAIEEAEKLTAYNPGMTVNLAISYGGRSELVDAVKQIVKNQPAEITEQTISDHLYTAGQPDPDLIIRTSGEERLSGFMLWQSAYAELKFIKCYWPDFSESEFNQVLADYESRQKRFGK